MTESRTPFLRIIFLMVVVATLFGSMVGRLYYLQVVRAPELREQNELARTVSKTIPAIRGHIVDRHKNVLARNKTEYTFLIDKKHIPLDPETHQRDITGTMTRIGMELGLSASEIQNHIHALKSKQARVLKRNVPEEEKTRIMEMDIDGIFARPTLTRIYPEGTLASHIVGYTGTGNRGLSGLEYVFNERMQGEEIVIKSETDIHRNFIVNNDYTQKSTRGTDIVLTIDNYIQHIVEREIKKTQVEFGAKQVNAVVIHPKSGEILAMANTPSFDPNEFSAFPQEQRKNSLLTNVYEPGSVLKPFTVIAALDQNKVTPSTVFDCSNGYFYGRSIRDDIHRFKDLTVHDILVRSSNIGTVHIARTLGEHETDWKTQAQVLYDYLRRFGFKNHGEPNTSELPGESVGVLKHPRNWWPSSVASIPYGQEISTNTLILTAAYAALANRGVYVDPTIVKGFRDNQGYFYPNKTKKPRRVVDHHVVDQVVNMLVDVVEDPEGTGNKHVRIPGFHIAGKTGTAQKVDHETGTYGKGMRVSSFAGFFPAHDPQAAIVVVVNEPDPEKGKYGGECAGPAWKAIAEEIIAYWGLTPTYREDPLLIAQQEEAVEENGNKTEGKTFGVTQIKPIPRERHFEPTDGQMPNLAGMTLRDAYALLALNGLSAEFEGSGKVVSQAIEAGTPLDGTTDVGLVECKPVLTDPSVPWNNTQVAQR